MALLFVIGSLSCVVLALASSGWNVANFEPSFVPEISPALQVAVMLALTPWAFMGFETISNAASEFNFTPKKSFKIMAAAILIGTILYIAMTFLTVSAVPIGFANWQEYVMHLDELEGLETLPTFYAANELLGNFGLILLTFSMFCAALTSAIGFYFASSRLMYSIAKDNCLPKRFSVLNAENIPANAIIFVMIVSLIIPFIGKTPLQWLTDVTTIGAIIAYGYVSAGTYFTARKTNEVKFKFTGALGTICSIILGVVMLAPNLLSEDALPRESYFILVVLSVLGVIVFRITFKRDTERRFGKSFVTWIVMLFIIFFCSFMWTRQTMTQNLTVATENIINYFTVELANYGLIPHPMHRLREGNYIREQMDEIRNNLFVNNIVQIGLIIFTLFIMFNVYSIMRARERVAEEARIRAEENNYAKTYFLSNMSKNIRTPMNAIVSYAKLALRENTSPEQMREFLSKIDVSSHHLLVLINDVLEMSDIESGKIELNEEPADLVKMLEDVRDMFTEQMNSKNITFTVEFSNVKNRYVLCDKYRLDLVLLNLTSNAYKFTPDNGRIEIILRELPCRFKGYANYELHVKDSGIGMNEEFSKKIFEPFEREKDISVNNVQGTGLGMAMTKSIIDLMRGKISVITKKSLGTEFIVNVQFAIASTPQEFEMKFEVVGTIDAANNSFVIDSPQEFLENVDNPAQELIPPKKILLAEDDEVNHEIILMILHEFGFKVEIVGNGKAAVDKIATSQVGDFDAILMNIQLPIMNGYEATLAIRSLENKNLAAIPIIALIDNAFIEGVEQAKAVGMNAYIAKPLNVPVIMETLKKVLGER